MPVQQGKGSPSRPVGSFRTVTDRSDRKNNLIPATVVHTGNIVTRRKGALGEVRIATDGAPFATVEINLDWIIKQLKKALPDDYHENKEYYDGDHWRDGEGWGGPRPEVNAPDGDIVMEQIQRAFTSKNCVKEVTSRKVNGVIGKEPSWHLTSRTAALDNKIAEIVAREAAASGQNRAASAGALPAPISPQPAQTRNGRNGTVARAKSSTEAQSNGVAKPAAADGETAPAADGAPPKPVPDAAATTPETEPLDPAVVAAQQEQAMRIADLEDALTTWWDERKLHTTLDDLVMKGCLAGRATLRIYVPPGLVDEGGALVNPSKNLRESLKSIYVHCPEIDECAVVTDASTMRDMGMYHFKDEDGNEHAEIVYINTDGVTVVREVQTEAQEGSEKSVNVIEDEMQMQLGGRMTIFEIKIPKLITEQVRQLQKLVNKALTMGGENVNLAGFLERTILNGQLPGHTVEETFADGRKVKRFVRDKMELGGGAVNSIIGVPMFGPNNEFQGLAQPDIRYREPVGPEQFEKTVYMAYRALLEEVDQVHYLLSGEQYASGESRKQARADFIASLRKVRGAMNELGRWLIETVLAYGTWLAGGGSAFEDLRAVFDARLDPGPATSDEINMSIQLNEAGGLSTPTMMAWSGVDDVDAELLLVRDEMAEKHVREMETLNAQTEQQIAVVGAKTAGAGIGPVGAANGGGSNNKKRNEKRPVRGAVPKPAPAT